MLKQTPNGLAVSHTYDAADWLTLIENIKASGTAQSIFTYTYDSVGNRLTEDALDGTRTTWTYDRAYQLTEIKQHTAAFCFFSKRRNSRTTPSISINCINCLANS